MSNMPSLPDANRSHLLELIALENLGKSFRNVYIFIAITFAIIIFFYAANFTCSFFTKKALTETSTVFFLICWFGGMIYFAYAAVVLILFLINIWNTPLSIVRGGGIGKVFIGLLVAGIGLTFFSDVIPVEYISLFDYVYVFLVIIEMIIFKVYLNRLSRSVGSSSVKSTIWFLCGAILCITLLIGSMSLDIPTIGRIEYIAGFIFGLVSLCSFFFSFYLISSDILTYIDNQRQQIENCQPDNQQEY